MIERYRIEKKNVESKYEELYDVEIVCHQNRSSGELKIRLLIKKSDDIRFIYIIDPQTVQLKYKNNLVNLIKDKLSEYEETIVNPVSELKEWSGKYNE